jgi:glycerophosphoryl diester phosphodiesterase
MSKVLNIAHRGLRKSFPDNTLKAFEAAIKMGVDGIECDIHETADQQFVVFHDNDIDGRSVNAMTLEEIRQVRLAETYYIPTLEETLELCHQRVRLNLELKLVYSLDRFMDIVRTRMQPDELILSSFYGYLISDLAGLAPEIPGGILTDFPVDDPLALIKLTKAQIILPRFSFASRELVAKLHAQNLAIIVWDCNRLEDLRTALAWGVDGIITDNPDFLAQEKQKEN